MSFFGEVAAAVKESFVRPGSYNIINYGGESVYIEGIKRVVFLSENKIELLVLGALVTFEGKELKVFELEKESLIIKGSVTTYNAVKTDNK